jgi:hypothetical protein
MALQLRKQPFQLSMFVYQNFLIVVRKLSVPEMKAPRFLRAPLISLFETSALLARFVDTVSSAGRALFRPIFVSRSSDMSRDFIGEAGAKSFQNCVKYRLHNAVTLLRAIRSEV